MANTKEETKRKTGKIKTLFQKVKRKFTHAPLSEEGKTSKLTPEKQEELNEKLLDAVRKNNIKEVETYLRLEGDVNYQLKDYLSIAIVSPLTATVKIPFLYEPGSTLLMIASTAGLIDICKLLIENGANINIQARYGATALIGASIMGHTEIVKLLIENGADVNVQGNGGWTALMWAVQSGCTEYPKIVKHLLSVGANPLAKNKDEKTADDFTNMLNRKIKETLRNYMKLWELVGEKRVLKLLSYIKNCEPTNVGEIFKGL